MSELTEADLVRLQEEVARIREAERLAAQGDEASED